MSVLNEIYRQLLTEPDLLRDENDLNNGWISFRNGTLQLATAQFFPPSAGYLTTFALRCNYLTASCTSPCFDAFLRDITRGDSHLILRIWQILGYIFSTDTSAKVLFLFQGVPDSGKSVLCKLILRVFDQDQQTSLNVHELGDKFAAGNLKDRRICISGDMPAKALNDKAISLLKQFTGDDLITADVKYSQHAKFFCRANFVLVSNHPLTLTENDPAFFRRLVTVPFLYSTPPEQRDPHLLDRLTAELDAIVTRALGAYFQLRANHYQFAGIFPVNGFLTASDLDISANAHDFNTCLVKFLKESFEPNPKGYVFQEEAWRTFLRVYHYVTDIPIERDFYIRFANLAHEMFGANKSRKRPENQKNPRACLEGLSWIRQPAVYYERRPF